MMLSRRLRGHNLIEEEDLYTLITKFKSNVKTPFMNDLIAELNDALKINDPVLLAFDVFNVCVNFPEEERKHHTEVLLTFYGTAQSSTFQSNNSVAPAVLNRMVDDETIRSFFEDFKSSVAREEKKRNNEIKMLVQLGKLKAAHVDEYKDEHPIKLDRVYADMYVDKETYPSMMKLLKFALLITPSTANVERGFSILTLLCTKQRNRLSPKNIDRLMRIILLGPEKIEDAVWESLINKYKDITECRIDL